jgi:citronellol/citronellal dehydrogenase
MEEATEAVRARSETVVEDDWRTRFPFSLTGQAAIVTGGGTGIGEATTRLLASFGADVLITSRKVENLERVAADVQRSSPNRRIVTMQGDVRSESSCAEMTERGLAEFGSIDILVNNAGGSYMYPFLDTNTEQFDNNLALNLRGPYILTRLAAAQMVKQGSGSIVNISSMAGIHGVRGGAVYSAAKAGLQMITRVVAAELGSKGVRCNAIAVGTVASEGALRSWAKFGVTAESVSAMSPSRKAGQPEDIAWGVFFFVSSMASWINGQTLAIDGGPMLVGGLPDE